MVEDLSKNIHADGFGTLVIHTYKKSEFRSQFRSYSLMSLSKELEKDLVKLSVMFLTGLGKFLEAKKILPHLVKVSPDYPTFHVVTFSSDETTTCCLKELLFHPRS